MLPQNRFGTGNGSEKCSHLFDVASKALAFPLCDHCLGRMFARSGFGLGNKERGRAVRIALALEIEDPSGEGVGSQGEFLKRIPVHPLPSETMDESPKDEDDGEGWTIAGTNEFSKPWTEVGDEGARCWLCQDVFLRLEELADIAVNASSPFEFQTLQVGCRMDPSIVEREERLWRTAAPTCAEPLKEELNREIGKLVFERLPDKGFDRSNPDIALILNPLFKTASAQVKPLFIYGRYRKLERGIPQTRWPCRKCGGKGCERCGLTGKMYQTSVEELMGEHFKSEASAEDYTLHGMGREDIDVITIGRGRPFILELSRPRKRTIDLQSIMERVNTSAKGRIEIDGLRMADRKDVVSIKDGAYLKRYRALIRVDGEMDEETLKYNISLLARSPIHQRTPARVSHRRADKVRNRALKDASVKLLDDGRALVEMLAEGGLYIKELLHGDNGRTVPSLSSLLGRGVTVLSLDVTDVLYGDKEGEEPGVEEDGQKVQGNNVKHPPNDEEEPQGQGHSPGH